MPICPFCARIVTVSKRGYINRHHASEYSNEKCLAVGLSIPGATQYIESLPLKERTRILMGMQNPQVAQPLDKFSEVFPDGTPFFLEGIRIVKSNTEFGQGEMVVVKVRGQENELGVWGDYLLAQARSVSREDLNQWYVLSRRVVEGFSTRAVKVFDPTPDPNAGADANDPGF